MEFLYSILSLLPFSWAQSDGLLFMKNAFLAILVITPLFGLLSTMVVTNRMSFFSDALGHSAFTGMAIGTLAGALAPTPCAVVFAVVFALLFTFARRRAQMSSDTVIGVFSSTAVALGIFIATVGGQSFTKFNSLLIGDVLSVAPVEIGLLFLILIGVVVLWLFSLNKMLLTGVHPALADSRGVHVALYEALFSVAIALVVTLSMSWVGLMVINSMLVLPGAAARNIARNMRQYHLLSVLGALIAGIAGILTSFYIGASAGATITLYLALFFLLSFSLRKK
jgi:zinc transport system permease protein